MSTYKDVLDEILVELRRIGDRLNKTTGAAEKVRAAEATDMVSDDGPRLVTAAEKLYIEHNVHDVPAWSELTNRERHGWRTAADYAVRYKHQAERAEKAEGQRDEVFFAGEEPAESAPVEVTEEPAPGTHLVSLQTGDKWRRAMGCERWHNDTVNAGYCQEWDNLNKHHGPLALAEGSASS